MATSQRLRRSASQWREIMTQFSESGLSATAFCKHNELAYGTFARWRQKLSNSNVVPDQAVSSNDWLPIHLMDTNDGQETAWEIELSLPGGVHLRMRSA
jgi:predicted metal-dependent phosphoesterase TrpH